MSKLENDPQEIYGEMQAINNTPKEKARGVWFIFIGIIGFLLSDIISNGFSLGKLAIFFIYVVILVVVGASIRVEEKSL